MSSESDWKARSEIFMSSYQEVLAALKHQDDKLSRMLTAIAFLTAAGASIYTNMGRQVDLTFDGRVAHVPTVLFVVFLIAVVFALGSALSAIGPSRPVPWTRAKDPSSSLLFYASIAKNPAWSEKMALEPAALYRELARNLNAEARGIAKRVLYKMARAREAGAFVQAVIVALSLLGLFSVDRFPPRTRWWIAATLMAAALLMPLWERFQMLVFHFPEGETPRVSYLLVGLIALVGIILLFGAPFWEARWEALGFAGISNVLVKFSTINSSFARGILPVNFAAGCVLLLSVLISI